LRERLLSTIGLFFAGVALLLAVVGLYGVLDYSVVQRRREIGIRLAIGARPSHIARIVTTRSTLMVLTGATCGFVVGLLTARYLKTLLYQVRPADPAMLAVPLLVILASAGLAAVPALWRAIRTDPAGTLRAD